MLKINHKQRIYAAYKGSKQFGFYEFGFTFIIKRMKALVNNQPRAFSHEYPHDWKVFDVKQGKELFKADTHQALAEKHYHIYPCVLWGRDTGSSYII